MHSPSQKHIWGLYLGASHLIPRGVRVLTLEFVFFSVGGGVIFFFFLLRLEYFFFFKVTYMYFLQDALYYY